jgi:hypothetical protein
MANINAAGVNFPNVTNFSINEIPVYVAGVYIHEQTEITIEGVVIGDPALPPPTSVDAGFVLDLFTRSVTGIPFDVEIGTEKYEGCILKQISTDESDYDYIVNYNATFVSSGSFISSLTNEWSVSEEGGLIIATHTMSATALSDGSADAYSIAKAEVDTISSTNKPPAGFYPEQTKNGILTARSEVFDRAAGSYTLTEVYNFQSDTSEFIAEVGNYTLTCSLDISYDRNADALTVGVKGTIDGGIGNNSATPDISSFDEDKAITIAEQFVGNSINQSLEGFILETLVATGVSVTKDDTAHKIEFSYTLLQIEAANLINDNVIHDYQSNFSVSKDSPYVEGTIQGTLIYGKTDFPIDLSRELHQSVRWGAIDAAFTYIDPRALMLTDFTEFLSSNETEYKLDGSVLLGLEPTSFNVTKNLETMQLNYTYSNNNKFDYGQPHGLKEATLSVTDQKPLAAKISLKETIAGFAEQTVGDKSGSISVSVTSKDDLTAEIETGLRALGASFTTTGKLVSQSEISSGVKKSTFGMTKLYTAAAAVGP